MSTAIAPTPAASEPWTLNLEPEVYIDEMVGHYAVVAFHNAYRRRPDLSSMGDLRIAKELLDAMDAPARVIYEETGDMDAVDRALAWLARRRQS